MQYREFQNIKKNAPGNRFCKNDVSETVQFNFKVKDIDALFKLNENINIFHTNGLFLYPLGTENIKTFQTTGLFLYNLSDIFGGYRKRPVV